MTPLKNIYLLIARILSLSYPKAQLEQDLQHFSYWEDLVRIGSQQLMIPAIYWSLKQKQLLDALPEDLTQYLQELHTINFERNTSIQKQLQHLKQLLDRHHIDYRLIKGTAIINHIEAEAIGIRMIGDIDILINEKWLHKAQSLLLQNGYSIGHGFNYNDKNRRHLDRLTHPNYIAAVELHSSLLNLNQQTKLYTDKDCFETSGSTKHFKIPSKTTSIIQCILSNQINDRARIYNTINFKSYLDVILLGLAQDKALISELNAHKETHQFLNCCVYFFDDFAHAALNDSHKHYIKRITRRLDQPQLYYRSLKIKEFYYGINDRMHLLLTNTSYRRHIFRNKIFPKFN